MCEDCHCSDLKSASPVLKPRQGRPYIHIDGSVRYRPVENEPKPAALNQKFGKVEANKP